MLDSLRYAIYDTLESKYFVCVMGENNWCNAPVAKRAWQLTHALNFNHPSQTRYIIHQLELKRIIEEVK